MNDHVNVIDNSLHYKYQVWGPKYFIFNNYLLFYSRVFDLVHSTWIDIEIHNRVFDLVV